MELTHVFYIECMTSLRYAIPFIKSAKKLSGKEIFLAFNSQHDTRKYNSIKAHIERLQEVLRENNIKSIDISKDRIKVKKLFCIENVNQIEDYEELFSIQHGYDYTILSKNNKNSIYLVVDDLHANVLREMGHNCLVTPFPVCFWDWDYHIDFLMKRKYDIEKKSVLLYYPEKIDHVNIFKNVYERFKEERFETHVKQRRKNQKVGADFQRIYYDDIWYPSEAIFLSILSDYCIGFGSSAYVDLIRLPKNYIDIAVTDYSRQYKKPNSKNLVCITEDFVENFRKIDLTPLATGEKIRVPFDNLHISNFLSKIV